MSKFTYDTAKFIYLTSQLYENTALMDKFLETCFDTGANGYILALNNSVGEANEKGDEIVYDLSYMLSDSSYKYLSKMADFIYKMYSAANEQNKTLPPLWVSMPRIDSNNYGKIVLGSIDTKSKVLDNSSTTLTHFNKAIEQLQTFLKDKFASTDIWDNYIQGFFYNQESIYGTDFDENSPMNCKEIHFMNDFSYYVHNNLKKDLIWIPYLPTQDPRGGSTLKEADIFKRVGTVISATTCFDCAFLQPSYISVDSDIQKSEYEGDDLDTRHSKGLLNLEAIQHSVKTDPCNCLYYRPATDGTWTVVKEQSEQLSSIRKCIIGAEYEYNPYILSKELPVNAETLHKDIFDQYSSYLGYFAYYKGAFKEFIGSKPLALYWHGSSEYIDSITREISNIYLSSPYVSNIKSNPKYNSYYDCVSDNTMIYDLCDTLNSDFNEPDDCQSNFTFSSPVSVYEVDAMTKYANDIIRADNPNYFWFNSVNYEILEKTSDDLIKKISITPNLNTSINVAETKRFNYLKDLSAIVTSLKDKTLSTIDQFIKIHNWLVENVTYTTERSIDYDSAYGAIFSNIRKANSFGFSAALKILCSRIGIYCLPVYGYRNNEKHSWNYVKLDGKWRFVDSSLNHPTNGDNYRYRYFLREMPQSYCEDGSLPTPNVATDRFIKFGDVTQDGKITFADVSTLQQYISDHNSVSISPIGLIAADVDGNGILTSNDLSNITSKVSNNSFVFPVETKLDNYN
jgi:hypothetical protein